MEDKTKRRSTQELLSHHPIQMDRTLLLYYFPYKEEDDRHPTENILWERLKPAIKHLNLEDLATDPDCKICSRPLGEREELEAREPYETTFHNSGWNDSPIVLPCKHIVGYHCLRRKIHDWDWNACRERVENPGPLIVCPVCEEELNVVGDRVLFEDGEELRWLDELDPLLVEDSTILAEINKNTSPWWLEILRGKE
ncbi:hypothetical protein HYALB_00010414 [Hymenoscyphus albidus]|uniref:Uncharacterized protein n=1 Tax=Hymenoscyphus albidus TaxID=595503 RepID=A0A9N9QD46_9HELO|nr:hypothetical protein HYALB_00010414 [Hymenoscyphus albidus]